MSVKERALRAAKKFRLAHKSVCGSACDPDLAAAMLRFAADAAETYPHWRSVQDDFRRAADELEKP